MRARLSQNTCSEMPNELQRRIWRRMNDKRVAKSQFRRVIVLIDYKIVFDLIKLAISARVMENVGWCKPTKISDNDDVGKSGNVLKTFQLFMKQKKLD